MNALLKDELKPFLIPIFERKPVSVAALDVSGMTSYADAIIVVEAASGRQVRSIAEHIVKQLKRTEIHALGAEGIKDGQWALLDYGLAIIHIFEPETKALYDLEGFWADAPRINLSEMDPLGSKETGNDG